MARFPFDESMEREDKEWSWRVLNAGWLIAYDPLLCVSSAHRQWAGCARTTSASSERPASSPPMTPFRRSA